MKMGGFFKMSDCYNIHVATLLTYTCVLIQCIVCTSCYIKISQNNSYVGPT